ncbi:hypothetical protein P171DRAFT_34682 [Karstenula rhodostoma CBS 690.94]|uniref:Uncharacterized protein n=1 Tax=Karstenula rhodostoma CBS 690.94 TaxID=1392251 RepID=A0A9P4PJP6_9PLEO|nr:hypothetical protein P171DRAFT_34682 [Karstenula rhodostoma CBS 690.94]
MPCSGKLFAERPQRLGVVRRPNAEAGHKGAWASRAETASNKHTTSGCRYRTTVLLTLAWRGAATSETVSIVVILAYTAAHRSISSVYLRPHVAGSRPGAYLVVWLEGGIVPGVYVRALKSRLETNAGFA